MVWILDTLDVMGEVPPEDFEVFLKGGTCVQNYLPSNVQRFSKDIDLSLPVQEGFDVVESYVEELNSHLKERSYSSFLEARPGSPGGDVICFDRFFDPEYAEERYFGLHEGKGAWITVEFHVAEITPSFKKSKLSLLPALYGDIDVKFNCATRGKLLSDKIIASMGPYHEAREEAKDVLDLNAMLNNDQFRRRALEAKSLIGDYASKTGDKRRKMVKRSVHTIKNLGEEMTDERLATHVNAILPRDYRFEDLDSWVKFCDETIGLLESSF